MKRFLPGLAGVVFVCLARTATADLTNDYSRGFINRSNVLAVAAAITPETFPNSDDVLVDDYIREEYVADGRSVTWDEEYFKVLTEKGRREAQTATMGFSLPYGTAEYILAELVKPDGTIVPIDIAKQSRVMVEPSQMKHNIYNPNHKIVKLSLPGVEIGDVIRLLARRTIVKPRVPDTFSDYRVFEYTSPIKHLVYEAIGPRELPLRNIELRDEVAGAVTYTCDDSGAKVVHRWEVRDVPRMYREPKMPELHTVVQRLLVSTNPDWETISRWYWNLCLPHLETVTPEMKAKVAELVAGAVTRREKIERLFRFVSQEVRYMGITTETEAPGYEPHDVKTTFENRYGVCRDKGALLAAMLTEAGVPGYPVLIYNGPKKDPDVPQPYFNHAIAAAADGEGGYILMDPTDENTSELFPAYLGNQSYLVAHPEGEPLRTSPVQPASENLVRIASRGKLAGDGLLKVQSTIKFEGINDNIYRGAFARRKPEERRRFFEGLVKGRLAGATLTDYTILPKDMQDTTQPLTVTLGYEAPEYPIRGRDYTMLSLPWLGTGVGYVNFVLRDAGLDERRFPFLTDITCGVEEMFHIEPGDSVGELAALPEYAPIDTNGVTFSVRVTADAETGALSGSSRFLMDSVEFSPEQYLVLKQVLKDMEYERRKQPLFKTRRPAASAAAGSEEIEHDIEVLSDDTTVTIEADDCWTATRRVRKKVLTYSGKKKHSELKLGFNPVWESIELKSGIVTAADGTRKKVVPEEINVMDAVWVAGAPRYPAEKTMVVSLPGVEIGSTIEYEIEQLRRGFPFFSMSRSFNGHDPVQSASLTIVCPETITLNVLDLSGAGVTYTQEASEGRIVHLWRSGPREGVVREDSLPPWWSFNPTVFVTTGRWKEYAAAVGDALEGAARDQAQAAARARDSIAGAASGREKVERIRDFVAKTIRAAGPKLTGVPLAAVTPADRTLDEGYGNSADRAVVLCAMLKAAGFAPELVLTSSWGPRLESMRRPHVTCPQRKLFDTVLVRVEVDGEDIYLNDTDQYAALGATPHADRPGLTMDGATSVVRATEGKRDRLEHHFTIRIAENGDAVIMSRDAFYGNAFRAFHRKFAEFPPEERRRYYQELTAKVSQGAKAVSELVTDYESYPGRRRFMVRVPRYAVRSGEYLYFTLPSPLERILRLRADRRTNPWYRPARTEARAEYEIILPGTLEDICLLPADIQWTGPAGMGSVGVSTTGPTEAPNGRMLRLVREAILEPAVVPAADYPALLDINRRWIHPEGRTVMVRME